MRNAARRAALLVRAGSGGMTLGVPDSAGVPEVLAALTRVARYNSLEALERYFLAEPGEVAEVIVEPVAANMGVVAPLPGRRTRAGRRILREAVPGSRVAEPPAAGSARPPAGKASRP